MHIYKVTLKVDGSEHLFTSMTAIVSLMDSSLTGISRVQTFYNRKLRQKGIFENRRCKVERLPVNDSK